MIREKGSESILRGVKTLIKRAAKKFRKSRGLEEVVKSKNFSVVKMFSHGDNVVLEIFFEESISGNFLILLIEEVENLFFKVDKMNCSTCEHTFVFIRRRDEFLRGI